MITKLEEFSINAWPAIQTLLYDGWVFRFANGYTKRANSVNPLYASTLVLEEKLVYCESIFQMHELPVVFKLTQSVYPGNLDTQLQARGYRKDSPTSVQVLDFKSTFVPLPQTAALSEFLSDEWLSAFCRMSAVGDKQRDTLHRMLDNITHRHCFAAVLVGDKLIACGLGVLQAGSLGLFDIVTDSVYRRQGFARQIVNTILLWGQQNGAGSAYLQVMLNNFPALQLYSTIGFVEKYQYWYRIQS